MRKHSFKIGQKVRIKTNGSPHKYCGQIITLTKNPSDTSGDWFCCEENTLGWRYSELEAIDEPEKKPQFKVGDRVKIVSSPFPASHGMYFGKERIIEKIEGQWIYLENTGNDKTDGRCLWTAEDLELITPITTRYTGELREGMRVLVKSKTKPSCHRIGVVEDGSQGFGGVRFEDGDYEPVDAGGWECRDYYISRIISDPEEKGCGDKWDPGEDDTTGFTFRPYPYDEVSFTPTLDGLRETFEKFANERARIYGSHFKNSPKQGLKTIMSNTLKKATNLIHSQAEPLKSYLRLGWVTIEDTEFEVTDAGYEAMTRLFFGFGEGKSLGEYAQNEVKRLEKEEKKAKR